MAKNVLIMAGSPRKGGNSELLCDQFARGAEEAGHRVEKLSLRDQRIGFCVACDACQKNGGTCIHQDDMAEILDKMIAADVIVLATPVYFYTMNGQMKTLIDRTYARYTEISVKEFYFLMTAAVGSKGLLEKTLEGFRGFTDCLEGARERGVVFGTGAWQVGDIKKSTAMAEAYALGKTA